MNSLQWHSRFQQQARWTGELRRFIYHQVNISQCSRILEVGCGTGVITADMHAFTSASVFGVDVEHWQLETASRVDEYSKYVCSDVLASLCFAEATFELCLCHFLLLWLPEPLKGLKEMVRVTCPGGFISALAEPDYGGRIDYPSSLEDVGRMQTAALMKQGADPYIGRKLAALFHAAGLREVQVGVLGGRWGISLPPEERELEWQVLLTDLEDSLPHKEMEDLHRIDAQAWERGERVLFIPTFYALGRVP